jgi:hypothetical protein
MYNEFIQMSLKDIMFRSLISILLLAFFFVSACSSPSWFPLKKGTSYKGKLKELSDKEIIIVDKQEYVKVLNPNASGGKDQPKYLFIPIDEYLSKKETFTTPVIQREEPKKELSVSPPPLLPSAERAASSASPRMPLVTSLKKKVLMAHLDDRVAEADEILGDVIAEKLIKELDRRSQRILFVDYQMVKEFLEGKGVPQTELGTPKVLHYLNEVFGIHAFVLGHLSGPYVFTTKKAKDKEETSSAIIRIEVRLVDTLSGKTIKTFSANNPIVSAKEDGTFSEEKAKGKAIDLTIADLSTRLSKELDGLDWFCRIAKIDEEEVYLNAGSLTGLKVGDMLDVITPGQPGRQGETKGKIRISACFGIDASMGRLIQGKKPDANDILKLARREEN